MKDKIEPQHIHDVVPFQIKKFKMFPRTWVTSFEIFKFYYWVCFNSDQNQKINQQHFQISRWKINSALWKCHQRCFIQMVTPQDIIDFKSHSHWGWKGKFHVICLVIRVRNGRVVIGQILRVDSHAVWSLLWIKL